MSTSTVEREQRWRPVARFLVAVAVSAVICAVIYKLFVPKALPPQTDIVGFPTLWNINYLFPIFRYRMVVYAFPFFAIVTLFLLGWRLLVQAVTGVRSRPMS